MKVFVSYSTKNKSFVRRLAADMTRAGMEIWLDEHALQVGTDLAAIESAVRGSDCLVVVLSEAAAESLWVDREIEMAEEFGVRVLPVLLEDVHVSRHARFLELSPVDFRRHREYRRSTQRLIAAIEGVPDQARFLRAKEAVALVKAQWNPTGELFGISQQGVATLYSLANIHDWEFTDAADGTSRWWIAEFFDSTRSLIQAYAVVDSKVHDLPELHLHGTDPEPLPDSVTVYSCAVNHLQTEDDVTAMNKVFEESEETTHVSRRYSRFQPIPLDHEFIDSTAAVSAATRSAFGPNGPTGRDSDLFVLAKLECDKRYRQLPTWIVAFFDPTLTESVLTVGIDAATGEVRHPRMQTEILNADFFGIRVDEKTGNYVVSIANQQRAMENHIWDIPPDGRIAPPALTAAEAVAMAAQFLDTTGGSEQWQLAFLSNTGVVHTALSPSISRSEIGLMGRDGRAGQWVVEVCGHRPDTVTEGDRSGHRYPYRQIVCTRETGAVDVSRIDRLILTAALARTPLPADLLDAYEKARRFAIKAASVDFVVMSAALRRTPPEASWRFRFYDGQDIIAAISISIDGNRMIE